MPNRDSGNSSAMNSIWGRARTKSEITVGESATVVFQSNFDSKWLKVFPLYDYAQGGTKLAHASRFAYGPGTSSRVKIASDAGNLAQILGGLLENETAVRFVDGELDNGVIHHNELGRRCNVDALLLPHGLEVAHRLLRALRVGAIPVPSDVLPVRS